MERSELIDEMNSWFEELNVTTRCKWENVSSQLLQNPDRLNRIGLVLAAGDRKQLFNEYKAKLEKQQREQHRERVHRARESLNDAITRWRHLSPDVSFKNFAVEHNKEPWFSILPVSEMTEIFDDFMDKYTIEYTKLTTRELRDPPPSLDMIMPPTDSSIPISKWTQLQRLFHFLSNDKRFIPSHSSFQEVCCWLEDDPSPEWLAVKSEINRLHVWTEVVYSSISKAVKAETKESSLSALGARDMFVSMLHRMAKRGDLKPSDGWRRVAGLIYRSKQRVKVLANVMAVRGSQGSHPVELWQDWKADCEEEGVLPPSWIDWTDSDVERETEKGDSKYRGGETQDRSSSHRKGERERGRSADRFYSDSDHRRRGGRERSRSRDGDGLRDADRGHRRY